MKKLMLGLMMAFAVTAEAAMLGAEIDGLKYSLDTESKTATITGYDGSPTEVVVSEVEYEGQKYIVTSVGDNAFLGCSSLASVSLPSVTEIGLRAFQGCSSLASVSLPSVTEIEPSAFQGCSSLASVSLPSVTEIGPSAFFGCSSLASVSLPNATTVGECAFANCKKLTSVSLPLATTVGPNAFNGCSLLASVELLSVTTIGVNAFFNSNVLSSLLVNVEMKSAIETNGRMYYGISSDTTITYYDGLPISVVKAAEYKMVLRSGDMPLDTDEYKRACEVFGITPKTAPQVVQEDEIAVKKESIAAPSAGTVKVEDNKVQLGVTVLKTSDLTAEKKEWNPVKLTKADIDVDADGNIIVNVPVDSASGFMVIQTKDAAK